MDVNLMNKINIGLDLFQMEQLQHMLNEIKHSSNKEKYIMDDVAFNDIVTIVDNIQKCYGEALNDIGFTVYDHLNDKLDYPDKCNEVVKLINDKYQRIA